MTDIQTERQKRKEEGKRKKRQRIEESGGVRPRENEPKQKKEEVASSNGGDARPKDYKREEAASSYVPMFKKRQDPNYTPSFRNYDNNKNATGNKNSKQSFSKHRFGRVMETVPCRNKPRFSTLSIALPGSVLSNCQTRELRTLLVGQIARAATIYHVDEIIVFDDKLGKKNNNNFGSGSWRDFKRGYKRDQEGEKEKEDAPEKKTTDSEDQKERTFESRPHDPRTRNSWLGFCNTASVLSISDEFSSQCTQIYSLPASWLQSTPLTMFGRRTAASIEKEW